STGIDADTRPEIPRISRETFYERPGYFLSSCKPRDSFAGYSAGSRPCGGRYIQPAGSKGKTREIGNDCFEFGGRKLRAEPWPRSLFGGGAIDIRLLARNLNRPLTPIAPSVE